MARIAGLDVGGAHLKAALFDGAAVTHAVQISCPLWQGLDHLSRALDKASSLTRQADKIAVTMTGELSDLFPDRTIGVHTLIDNLTARFGDTLSFWMGQHGFASAAGARANPKAAGSTNFLASAQVAARHHRHALLIDFGSTTCDIIPVSNGAPCPLGLTDADRQVSGELVYTGFTRTAVMGVTTTCSLAGREYGLAREYLATMADVRRLLATLDDGLDVHATADGRGKSVSESRIRLARMFGHDASDHSEADWRQAAAAIADHQLESLLRDAQRVAARHDMPDSAPVIGAGIGIAVIADMAKRMNRPMIRFSDLVNARPDVADAVTHAAPAVAVAVLLYDATN